MQLSDVQYKANELIQKMDENYDYVHSTTYVILYGRRLDCKCYAKTVHRRNVFVYYVTIDNENIIDETESDGPMLAREQFSFFLIAITNHLDVIHEKGTAIRDDLKPTIVESTRKLFDVALVEKHCNIGMSRKEAISLLGLLRHSEVYPVEFEGDHENFAMGFITRSAAELLDYNYKYYNNSSLGWYIRDILNDVNLEREDCTYEYKRTDSSVLIKIFLSR